MNEQEYDERYIKAKEQVEELKGFYANVTSYVVLIPFLALVNYLTNGFGYPWFLWAAGAWAIGILFHASHVFSWNPFFGKDWEKRKIRELMREDTEEEKNTRWE